MNSTFDPDITNSGHQPYGRDQLAAVYAKYRVTHFRARISAVVETTDGVAQVATAPSRDPSVFALTYSMGEAPLGKIGMLSQGGPALVLDTPWISLREFLGQSEAEFLGDDSNESVVGNNPTQDVSFVMGQESPNGTTVACQYSAQLEYRVVYFAPITQTPS
jgi:hypothetical protein